MKTFEEICEDLGRLDELTLLEVLEVDAEEIVNAFRDRIESNYSTIYEKVTGESIEDNEDECY